MMFFGLNGNFGGNGLGLDSSGNNGLPMCNMITASDSYQGPCTNDSGDDTSYAIYQGGGGNNYVNSGSPTSPSQNQPWWSTALSALTKGVAQGVTSGPPKPPAMPVVPPTPWYKTPLGIGGIIFGGLAMFFVLKK